MSKFYNAPYEPPKCWVGDKQKIIYDSEEDADAEPVVPRSQRLGNLRTSIGQQSSVPYEDD